MPKTSTEDLKDVTLTQLLSIASHFVQKYDIMHENNRTFSNRMHLLKHEKSMRNQILENTEDYWEEASLLKQIIEVCRIFEREYVKLADSLGIEKCITKEEFDRLLTIFLGIRAGLHLPYENLFKRLSQEKEKENEE